MVCGTRRRLRRVGRGPSTGGSTLRHQLRRAARALGALSVGVLAIGLAVGSAGAQTLNTQGVTNDSVKLGFIWSGTGAAAPNFEDSDKACKARIDAQNAQGGVNGRKIQLETVDDMSSGANLTGAQDLVQNRKVFAVVNNSSFAFLAYRYLKGAGIPMIGGGFDGTYYSQKGNENIIDASGNGTPPPSGHHLHQRHRRGEEARRHQDRLGGLRRVAVVDRRRPRTRRSTPRRPRVSSPCTSTPRSTSAPPTSVPSCWGSRTRGPTRCTCRSTATRTSPSRRASSRTASP